MSTDLAGDKTVADARHIFMLAIECSINKCQELGFEHAVVMEAIKGTANSLISWGELADLINGPPSSPPALPTGSPPRCHLKRTMSITGGLAVGTIQGAG